MVLPMAELTTKTGGGKPDQPHKSGKKLPFWQAWRKPSILPGFGLTLGFSVAYLSLLILIPLTALYAPKGWIGAWLMPLDIRIAFTQAGIVVALVFIGLPFVVRTIQPVIEEISREQEEAAATLGASRFQTVFRVLLPGLQPAILTGFSLAFARAVGEYGSVIFIAGNRPYSTEIAPLLIFIKLEEFDYSAATVLATVMMLISFVMLLIVNLIQTRTRRRYGYGS